MIYRQLDLIQYLVYTNEYLETDEEKSIAFSAMAGALNWANKIDREERNSKMRYKGADALTRLNHSRYEDK